MVASMQTCLLTLSHESWSNSMRDYHNFEAASNSSKSSAAELALIFLKDVTQTAFGKFKATDCMCEWCFSLADGPMPNVSEIAE